MRETGDLEQSDVRTAKTPILTAAVQYYLRIFGLASIRNTQTAKSPKSPGGWLFHGKTIEIFIRPVRGFLFVGGRIGTPDLLRSWRHGGSTAAFGVQFAAPRLARIAHQALSIIDNSLKRQEQKIRHVVRIGHEKSKAGPAQ